MTKKCKLCGKSFTGSSDYCSKTCESTADRLLEYDRERFARINRTKKKRVRNETVREHCRHSECCHRGKLGHEDCCDYLIHRGTFRPHKISECPGYSRQIIQRKPGGEFVKRFNTFDEIAKEIGVSPNSVKNHVSNKNRTPLKGFYFRYESFTEKNFVHGFTNDNFDYQ